MRANMGTPASANACPDVMKSPKTSVRDTSCEVDLICGYGRLTFAFCRAACAA